MGCSSEEEFYRARMVLSMSPSRRNYSSSHVGMSILQGGMERGGKINRDWEFWEGGSLEEAFRT
jgi:hypothetical protein